MEFSKDIPIYIQIQNIILENILLLKWRKGDRIPSVRDFASSLEVNPNTVQRTFSRLQQMGVIENRRGIGYFITIEAFEISKKIIKTQFIKHQIPQLIKTMKLLNISIEELVTIIEKETK